ncbi:DUF6498-containing protein [Falsiroseomonas sp.]|uniref:DUF6498-containing protein n=1 Tax=Falsiroseomonas sp. TaxID=2870721 RepID=UPI0027358BBA|nr:DUF6498-containing protein [Falsiroseomonas sp.]MDP3417604.1 DUF6498-containing protein [Falsiroseomonas sp.]
MPQMPSLPGPFHRSGLVLVAANLVPMGGVLLGLWSVFDILLLYWAEGLVIGVFQLLRFAAFAWVWRIPSLLLLAAFFAIHYGLFALGHGVFILWLLGPPGMGFAQAIALLLSPSGLLLALLGLVASHGFGFVADFLLDGEVRRTDPAALMIQPYARVFLLHAVVLLGAATAVEIGQPAGMLGLLVALKIALDLRSHRAVRQPEPAEATPAP